MFEIHERLARSLLAPCFFLLLVALQINLPGLCGETEEAIYVRNILPQVLTAREAVDLTPKN